MPDNLKVRGPEDGRFINIHEDHEVRYWTKKFGCSPDELRAAVNRAGTKVEDVARLFPPRPRPSPHARHPIDPDMVEVPTAEAPRGGKF